MMALEEKGEKQAEGEMGGVVLDGVNPFPPPITQECISFHTYIRMLIYFAPSVSSIFNGRRGYVIGMGLISRVEKTPGQPFSLLFPLWLFSKPVVSVQVLGAWEDHGRVHCLSCLALLRWYF